jgi:hypothetical protein
LLVLGEMTEKHPLVTVHQLRIFLRGTSPHVWRRIVIPRHFTLTQLRQTINFLFGWSNAHPCGFVIRGKSFPSDPVVNAGRNFCTGADTVTVDESATPQTLSEFQFYPRERFLYNYRFERQTAVWQHEIRVEKTLSSQPTEAFPRCIAGAGSSIPAPVASPQELQHMQGLFTTGYILHRLTELIDDGASEQRLAAELRYLRPWLTAGQFSSGEVNRQLECLSGAAL